MLLEQFVSSAQLPDITNDANEQIKLSDAPKLKKGTSWLQSAESFNQDLIEEEVQPVKVTIKVSQPNNKSRNKDRLPADLPLNLKGAKQLGDFDSNNGDPIKPSGHVKNNKSENTVITARNSTETALKSMETKIENKREKIAVTNEAAYKSIEDKREREKTQIKEQYEKFRKLKSESDAIAASSNVKSLENNLDDIRSLLESLQGGTPIQTNGSVVNRT